MKHTLKNNKSKLIKKKLTINNKSKNKRFIYNYNNNKVNYYKHNNNNHKYMSGGSNIINFIKILEELSKIVKNKGDIFKASAYNKAISELKKYVALPNSVEITSAQELKKLKLPITDLQIFDFHLFFIFFILRFQLSL